MDGLGILSTRAGRTMESQYRPAMKLQVKGARMDIFAIYSTRAPPSAYSPRWNTLAHRATSIAWIKGSGLQGIDNRDGNSRNVGWVRHAVYAATHQLGQRSGPPIQAVLQGVGLRPTGWWVTPQIARLTHPCIMKLQLKYSGLPEREDRTPCPPLSGKVCGVDEAPVFPFLLREIGQYLWPDLVGSPHSQGRLREEPV